MLISREYLPLCGPEGIPALPGPVLGSRSWVQGTQPLLQKGVLSLQCPSQQSRRATMGPATTLPSHWINPTAKFYTGLNHLIWSQLHSTEKIQTACPRCLCRAVTPWLEQRPRSPGSPGRGHPNTSPGFRQTQVTIPTGDKPPQGAPV